MRLASLPALCVLLLPGLVWAQQGRKPLPITTGTDTSSIFFFYYKWYMDIYTHSPVVQAVARKLGLPVNQASRYFEDFNSGILLAALLYGVLKYVPGKLRSRRDAIAHDLQRARQATADAEARLKRVEARFDSLGGEVETLRAQAAENSRREEVRIHASLEEERQRIIHSAEQEIAAAQAAAERGLKRFASDLAVDRAAERVQVTPESDQALIEEFLAGLGAQLAQDPLFRDADRDANRDANRDAQPDTFKERT